MGLVFAKIWDRLFSKQEMRILMVGLDAAGKTTVCKIIMIEEYILCGDWKELIKYNTYTYKFFFCLYRFYTN